MYKRKIPIELNCGLDLVKEVIDGKWKIHLIFLLHKETNVRMNCKRRYRERPPRLKRAAQ